MMAHLQTESFPFFTPLKMKVWRVEIPGLPELTTVGGQRQHVDGMDEAALHPGYGSGPEAYGEGSHGSGFYTREEFIDILEYARDRPHYGHSGVRFPPDHARAAIQIPLEARDLKYK